MAGFFGQHDGDAVADGVGQAGFDADEFAVFAVVLAVCDAFVVVLPVLAAELVVALADFPPFCVAAVVPVAVLVLALLLPAL